MIPIHRPIYLLAVAVAYQWQTCTRLCCPTSLHSHPDRPPLTAKLTILEEMNALLAEGTFTMAEEVKTGINAAVEEERETTREMVRATGKWDELVKIAETAQRATARGLDKVRMGGELISARV